MTFLTETDAPSKPGTLIERFAAKLPTITEIAETTIVLGVALTMVSFLNAML